MLLYIKGKADQFKKMQLETKEYDEANGIKRDKEKEANQQKKERKNILKHIQMIMEQEQGSQNQQRDEKEKPDNTEEDGDDDDDGYQDDQADLEENLLKPHPYLLTLRSEQARLLKGQMLTENQRFQTLCLIALLAVFLIQTFVIIAIRDKFEGNAVIIGLRGGFCLALLFSVIKPKWLLAKNLRAVWTILLFSYGIILVAIQAYYAEDVLFKPFASNIQLLEISLLFLVQVTCK